MNRKDIIQIIIDEQKEVVQSLMQSVERYKVASDLDEESTHDPEDFSHQTQAKDMQLRYEQMLKEAERNLDFLNNELNEKHETIEKGTLVETDQNYLFVGVPVPVFKFNEKDVVTFSDQAPVFENIKGKNTGDLVEVGKSKVKILAFS